MNKEMLLALLSEQIMKCKKCKLHKTRTNPVFGYGNINAKVMFVGEAPGADEDRQGLPFVGDCGLLLTDIIEKGMKMKREDVFITNLVKCRPSINNGNKNRPPDTDEVTACCDYLIRQIKVIGPEVIISLGGFASQFLLKTNEGISRIRGKVYNYMSVPVVPTYHPSYVKNYAPKTTKLEMWTDIKLALNIIGIK